LSTLLRLKQHALYASYSSCSFILLTQPSPPPQQRPPHTSDCRSFLLSLTTATSRRIIVIDRHERGPLFKTSCSARTSNRTHATTRLLISQSLCLIIPTALLLCITRRQRVISLAFPLETRLLSHRSDSARPPPRKLTGTCPYRGSRSLSTSANLRRASASTPLF
jgi:hypothetical protein